MEAPNDHAAPRIDMARVTIARINAAAESDATTDAPHTPTAHENPAAAHPHAATAADVHRTHSRAAAVATAAMTTTVTAP
jgi:hypothetical protein